MLPVDCRRQHEAEWTARTNVAQSDFDNDYDDDQITDDIPTGPYSPSRSLSKLPGIHRVQPGTDKTGRDWIIKACTVQSDIGQTVLNKVRVALRTLLRYANALLITKRTNWQFITVQFILFALYASFKRLRLKSRIPIGRKKVSYCILSISVLNIDRISQFFHQ